MLNDLLIQIALTALAAIIAWIPVTRRAVARVIQRLNGISPQMRRFLPAVIFVLSALYLYCTAILQGRTLLPLLHDEQLYRLQTSILASGHLWLPALPLAKFFETFYVFVTPVYAPIYFPGTAMLNVPAAILGLPYFLTPLLVASATAALLYCIVSELIDNVSGILAVVLLLSLPTFRWLSTMEMSHGVGLFWAVAVFYCWLRWRKSPRWIWLIVGALCAGWFAITRPLDAVCAVGPVAVLWCIDLVKQLPARRIALSIVVASLIIAPFIALQLYFDRGVTGHWLHTPVAAYDETYFNLHGLGFEKFDPNFRPPTSLPEFQAMYRDFLVPQIEHYGPAEALRNLWTYRLPLVAGATIPSALLLILAVAGLLGLRDRRFWALWIVMPLYLGAMFFYASFLNHYCAVFMPAAILMVLLGRQVLTRAWPARGAMAVFCTLAVLMLSLISFPEINGRHTEATSFPIMEMNYFVIPKQVQAPAVVLFRYAPRSPYDQEPVYNWDVAWPDDAPIIRAHDLGDEQDRELFQYYAKLQPQRGIYRFDRGTMTLQYLGIARDIASQH